jgi:hypothetical protein
MHVLSEQFDLDVRYEITKELVISKSSESSIFIDKLVFFMALIAL